MELSKLNLPPAVTTAYESNGITNIFEWQSQCLNIPNVLQGKNLIYSAPTSAGKTLVAEILTIKTVIEKEKKALFILPYKAVVHEKTKYFKNLLKMQGIKVGAFMGKQSPLGGLAAVNIAVCVIEKANSIINNLILEKCLNEIGIVVIDELHQLVDNSRGYLLELIITKLLYLQSRKTDWMDKIQIVGMSATLPNLSSLANWMNAELYTTTFRPVPLDKYAIHKSIMYNERLEPIGTVQPDVNIENDEKHIAWLCLQTVIQGNSALVFCTTKAQVEAVATKIAFIFYKIGTNENHKYCNIIKNELKSEPIEELLEELKMCPSGLNNTIRRVVSFAVGIHHAGISDEEREIIEKGFRSNALRVMVATSTLCSGVNLPARRVIICYSNYLEKMMYQQMSGRAGRMGIDTMGESYLVLEEKQHKLQDVSVLMKPQLENKITSSLWSKDNLSSAFIRSVMELIACDVAEKEDDIRLYLNSGLYLYLLSEQGESISQIEVQITQCLQYLITNELIKKQESGLLLATRLGKACLSAAMPPEEAIQLYIELEKAQKHFVLNTDLHLIYLAVPNLGITDIDWFQWMSQFNKLPAVQKAVADAVGVDESFIHNSYRNNVRARLMAQNKLLTLERHVRFRRAISLLQLVNEEPLDKVADTLGVPRGTLQSMQQSAAMQAGRVTAFCRELGWRSMQLLMDSLQDRLQFGIQHELCEIMKISNLNAKRARFLFDNGYTTLTSLANTTIDKLEKTLTNMAPFQADKEQEGESSLTAQKRRELKTLFVTGQSDLTERQAAIAIIDEARKHIQENLGVSDIKWNKLDDTPIKLYYRTECPPSIKRMRHNSPSPVKSPDIFDISPKELRIETPKTRKSNVLEPLSLNKSFSDQPNNASIKNLSIQMQKDNTPSRNNLSIQSNEPVTELHQKENSPIGNNFSQKLSERVTQKLMEEKHKDNTANHNNASLKRSTDEINVSTEQKSLELFIENDIEKNESLANMSVFDVDLCKVMEEFENQESNINMMDSLDEFANLSLLDDSPNKIQERLNGIKSPDLFECDDSLNEENSINLDVNIDSLIFEQQSIAPILENHSPKNTTSKRNLQNKFDSPPIIEKKLETKTNIVVIENREIYMSFAREVLSKKKIAIILTTDKWNKTLIGESNKSFNILNSPQLKQNYKTGIPSKKIIGVSINWGTKTSFYLDLTQDTDNVVTLSSKVKLLQQILEKCDLIIYEAKQELLLLSQWTNINLTKISIISDPLIAAWLLDSDLAEDVSLYSMVSKYCPEYCELLGKYKRENNLDTSIKALVTFNLNNILHTKLIENNLLEAYKVELNLISVLVSSESIGYYFNSKVANEITDVLRKERKKLINSAHDLVKWKFNLNSPQQVATVLYDKLGLKVEKYGKNTRSTCKEILMEMSNGCSGNKMPSLILDYRKIDGILSKILEPIINLASREGLERIHPIYTTRSVTGRVYVKEPNLQSIPRDFMINGRIVSPRQAFQAAPGNILISVDYSQIELRLLAHFSKDTILLSMFEKSTDMFKDMASNWFQLKYENVSDDDRQNAKRICYGIMYGISAESLQNELKSKTLTEAQNLITKFHTTFPEASEFLRSIVDQMYCDGKIETLLGRNRYFNKTKTASTERQAMNTVLQGSAADISKLAAIDVIKALRANKLDSSTHLILHLHDELILETRKEYLNKVVPIIISAMENVVKLNVALKVKVRSGVTWAGLIDYK